MVSPELTELGEGTVEYKPEPKAMPDMGNGAWKSYSVKILEGEVGIETWFNCNSKVYNAIQKGDNIKFTYATNDKGYHKIADLVGGVRTDAPPESTPTPQGNARPTPGMIGALNGAEVGAMENRACQLAIAHGTLEPEDIQALLMEQAWLGSWFRAQQIPSLDDEPVPLQDDAPQGVDFAKLNDARKERLAAGEPDWSDEPDPTAQDEMPF